MPGQEPIQILCVDDHPIVLEGLQGVLNLQPDFRVVGTAATAEEALRLFNTLHPDIVLLDLRLRNETGFDVLQQMLSAQKTARVVMLTSFEGDADIQRALALGARGYILKGAPREQLAMAIRAVHAGRRFVPGDVAMKLAEHVASEKLSTREYDVLAQMALGKSNKEIGSELRIAEDTVKMHVKNVFAKLGVNDRTEAVMVGVRRGFLHME